MHSGEDVKVLYVSWFRKVGDESYHHPHVHACAYGDGESGEEQGSSRGDVGQWEVTFVHRLGGLRRREKKMFKKKKKVSLEAPQEESDPLSRRIIITRAVCSFSSGEEKKGAMGFEDRQQLKRSHHAWRG